MVRVKLEFTDRDWNLLLVAVEFAEKMAAFVPRAKAREFADIRKNLVIAELESRDVSNGEENV